jgi:hypothetical protein
MTMLSFRVPEDEATSAQQWADQLGVPRSDLLREALRRELVRLASEHDVTAWLSQPLTPEEAALAGAASWGAAEDWSDWSAATPVAGDVDATG